ncbi:benzoate transporter BenE [Nakamurella antarctica]|uniref:Benzoate transporter BenE n=1 Tax=Nakamurella antarctica TaxID=1902245 RepID=A0A3G8ZUY6_9ACTN|nr:benzoate/H(+) symporter BenE family transporter [Nakamurella antarctica]AZI58294.1 benzoate transporter BenE [Nakamurella antarctica]
MSTDVPATARATGVGPTILTGFVAGIVGFTSSFAVVLTGLRALGANDNQAASGLFIICLTMGAGCVIFSLRYRMPITMAWSTAGAALMAGASVPTAGYASALGAFAFAGILYAASGLIAPLGRWVRMIPTSLANAMLAGILVTLCVQPFTALAANPLSIAPVLLTWLIMLRISRRWAVPAALVTALVVIAGSGSLSKLSASQLVPHMVWTTPTFSLSAVIAIGVPLYLVTMTSQNIAGTAVMATFGYAVPLRQALTYTGAATALGAGLGGFTINLSAIAAAIPAGPGSHPDPAKRWIAGVGNGVTYLAFGPLAAAVAAISVAAPAGIVASIAGLALIGSFAAAAASALADPAHREVAAITFVVAASGMSFAGISAAFWALVAGGMYLAVMRIPHMRKAKLAGASAATK